MKKISISFVLFLIVSFNASAFDLNLWGDNSIKQSCATNRRTQVQQALDKQTYLALEGFMLDDLNFNNKVSERFPGGSFQVNQDTQIYGVEESKLYGLTGLYMFSLQLDVSSKSYFEGNDFATKRMKVSIIELANLIIKYPDFARTFYGKGKVPKDVKKDMFEKFDALFSETTVNLEEIADFKKKIQAVKTQYRKQLTTQKLYLVDQAKIKLGDKIAMAEKVSDKSAGETFYYNYVLRPEVIGKSIVKLIARLKKANVESLNVIVGKKLLPEIKKTLNNAETSKEAGSFTINNQDLCF